MVVLAALLGDKGIEVTDYEEVDSQDGTAELEFRGNDCLAIQVAKDNGYAPVAVMSYAILDSAGRCEPDWRLVFWELDEGIENGN